MTANTAEFGDNPSEASITVRVRYSECDPMGLAHHASHPVWMEMARTELLRSAGTAYRDLEATGVYFLVTDLQIRYRRPARYDDALTVTVRTDTLTRTRLTHTYTITRDGLAVATGHTVLACVDSEGRPVQVPTGFGRSGSG